MKDVGVENYYVALKKGLPVSITIAGLCLSPCLGVCRVQSSEVVGLGTPNFESCETRHCQPHNEWPLSLVRSLVAPSITLNRLASGSSLEAVSVLCH